MEKHLIEATADGVATLTLTSSALNYDPKFHLKHSLNPLDLYVRHTSKFINPILRRLLPLLEPTRNDKTLPKFSNYADLWARQHGRG
jgi:hypothetical protein